MIICDKCKYPHDIRKWPCVDCLQGDRLEPKPLTNADRIRSMTDEELAEWINEHDCHTNLYGYDPKYAIIDWLKEEIEDGGMSG